MYKNVLKMELEDISENKVIKSIHVLKHNREP